MKKLDREKVLEDDEKREMPTFLVKLLETDVILTKRFVSFMLNFIPIRSLKTYCKFLEYSCHGIIWLAGWLAFCWLTSNPNYYQMQMNMFIGLLLDIIFVAVIKAYTRRRRPSANEDFFTIGPDKFSFPSGHVSRSVFITLFFIFLDPLSFVFWPSLLGWSGSVALSRLLLYRHHILDVCGGILLGIFESLFMYIIWLNPDTARWVMSLLSDDNLPGGETQMGTF